MTKNFTRNLSKIVCNSVDDIKKLLSRISNRIKRLKNNIQNDLYSSSNATIAKREEKLADRVWVIQLYNLYSLHIFNKQGVRCTRGGGRTSHKLLETPL